METPTTKTRHIEEILADLRHCATYGYPHSLSIEDTRKLVDHIGELARSARMLRMLKRSIASQKKGS